MQVFLDLDGVLVDFVSGAFKFHNKYLPIESVEWDFNFQMGLKSEEFWNGMNFDFWSQLGWTAEGKQIVSMVKEIVGFENITLLTSPSKTDGCVDGKLAWIKRELPEFSRKYLIGPAKQAIAGPGKLMIDDYEVNTSKFKQAGGQAILVPRPWNSLKYLTKNGSFDINWLREQLDKYR